MSLITDYRPEEFDEFIGSSNTIKTTKAKIESDSPPHSYLITGPSGCGKTTLGRIIAKELGAFDIFHYTEFNTSDFRGIEMIRELRRNVNYMPNGKNKARVWLLDEVHGLTPQAQEAMLKLLEEPPNYVYFILCTTDPQKLKTTLKRRCLQLHVENISDEELNDYLCEIIESEEKEVTEETLDLIIENAEGSIGVALSLLESVIDIDADEMEEELNKKKAELNGAIDLCRALMKNDSWRNIAKIIRGIKENKLQPESVRQAVLGYCSSILLKGKKDDMAYVIMDCFRSPFYDSPYPQLVLACYEVIGVE